jgi:hypothetical protein
MKTKLFILPITISLWIFCSYGQDSIRTKNDKPGTTQSLRKSDQTPQNHVQIINTQTPTQADVNRPSESNTQNNTTQQTITTDPNKAPVSNPTNPITITTKPPANMQSKTNSSAIQNGISNTSKPLRNK